MKVVGFFALLLAVMIAVVVLERRAANAHRRHMEMREYRAAGFAEHWYLGTDEQPHLRPGHHSPYDDDEMGDRGDATTQPATAPTARPTSRGK
jgi:hypothetical protein